jgi:hypothetical protein
MLAASVAACAAAVSDYVGHFVVLAARKLKLVEPYSSVLPAAMHMQLCA